MNELWVAILLLLWVYVGRDKFGKELAPIHYMRYSRAIDEVDQAIDGVFIDD